MPLRNTICGDSNGNPEFPDNPNNWSFLKVVHWQEFGKDCKKLAFVRKEYFFITLRLNPFWESRYKFIANNLFYIT